MSLYISQDYASQIGNANPVSSGNPGNAADGVQWPFDPNGKTPDPSQFAINWNSNPPPSAQDIEQAYERLVTWIRNNPGCYNADIMLLQMTTEIGQHLGSLPASEQSDVMKCIANQLSGPVGKGSQTLLQAIIEMAAQGAAVSQSSLAGGKAAAEQFLDQLSGVLSGLQGFGPPFSTMNQVAQTTRSTIDTWCDSHFKTFTDPATGASKSTWIDDTGNPISDFTSYTSMAAFSIGLLINGSNVEDTINAYYRQEIAQLVAAIHDPMALLAALMNLINQRDQDNGQSVNGYGSNLNTIQQANGLVQKLLGDISGTTPNAADFFTTLQQLKTLVEQDPSLTSVVDQLESDMKTINGQSFIPDPKNPQDISYSVKAGYYNFPPNTKITYNGKTIVVSGETYLDGGTVTIAHGNIPATGFTFGQLAAMGDTTTIQSAMTNWSSTVMSNFENGVTGIQTLLNGASPAIQQQIQNTTQTMQAEENFEKEAYDSITNLNQQIMKLIQQVMG